jgi:hypothetical protein
VAIRRSDREAAKWRTFGSIASLRGGGRDAPGGARPSCAW